MSATVERYGAAWPRDGAPPQAPPELRPGLGQGSALDPWTRFSRLSENGGSAPEPPGRAPPCTREGLTPPLDPGAGTGRSGPALTRGSGET